MKFQDIKKKNPIELVKELETIEFDLMRYNAKVATNSIGKDSGKVKELKKDIARIKTLQNQVAIKTLKSKSAKPVQKSEQKSIKK